MFADDSRATIDELAGINPPPPVTWTANALLGASSATGNTERRSVNLEANATRRSSVDRLGGDVQWSYAEEDSGDGSGFAVTQRRISGGGQYDYFFSDKGFALANVRAVGDELANIELRFTAGAGVGYQWIENDTVSFLTEAGLNFVSENFSDPTSRDVDYIASRVRYRAIWNILSNLRLDHGVTFLNSLEDPDDFLINKQTNLDLTLSDQLFTQFSWELDYDNTPASMREETDQRFFINLGYSF